MKDEQQRCNYCMTVQPEENIECEKCGRDDALMYPFEPIIDKHTPGPWWFAETDINPFDGTVYYAAGVGDRELTKPIDKANARMIAAAPDLLAALESLLSCTELNLDELESDTALKINKALAAIKKAKGKSCL